MKEIQYNENRHSVTERISPPFYHSRYVHLRSLNENIQRVIDQYVFNDDRDLKFVDFGCGELPYKERIEKYCKEYIAIDIPGNPNASHYIDIDSNKTPLESNSNDLVWSIQVLEHVADYDKYLQEANRILKQGGVIIASTHGQWKFHPDPIDFWRWTSDGLKETFRKHGFEVVSFSGSLSFLSVSIQLFQDACLLSFPGEKYWKNLFCFFAQTLMRLTEKFSRLSKTLDRHRHVDSDVFFIIGRKM